MAVINLIARVRSTGVNLHYAWFIVGMATILQLTTNVVSQAFAILLVVMQDNFGWTLTTITLAYFFRSIVGAVLSPVAGWLGDRYGARPAMISGVVLYVAAMKYRMNREFPISSFEKFIHKMRTDKACSTSYQYRATTLITDATNAGGWFRRHSSSSLSGPSA